MLGPDFIPLLEAMLVDEGDHPVVLLGMHLCGLLSVRAVEVRLVFFPVPFSFSLWGPMCTSISQLDADTAPLMASTKAPF